MAEVAGRCIDPDTGLPLAGLAVTLSGAGALQPIFTGPDGTFSFRVAAQAGSRWWLEITDQGRQSV